MIKNENAPEELGPTSAHEILYDKDSKIFEIIDESVIIYRTWYECLEQQGKSCFNKAMTAMFAYAFYNEPIESSHLTKKQKSIVQTFIPIIDANRKRRAGGAKGGKYGERGGRPKHTAESMNTDSSAMITIPKIENINQSLGYEIYIPVFFFRNTNDPERQAKKFDEHYKLRNWKLSGGEQMVTAEQRVALAEQWEIRDDSCNRFKEDELKMLKKLYEIAPDQIKRLIIKSDIKFATNPTNAWIYCEDRLQKWIESQDPRIPQIVGEWRQGRNMQYRVTNHVDKFLDDK